MKRFFTTAPLLFSLCASAAILFAFQQNEPTSLSIASSSLEEEFLKLRQELTEMQANRVDEQHTLVPPGTVTAYMGADAPKGWLLCDGQTTLDKPEYVDLKKVLNGADKVPNYCGYFLRGLDQTGKIDPDGLKRTLSSPPQGDTFASHKHTAQEHEHTFSMINIDVIKGAATDAMGWRHTASDASVYFKSDKASNHVAPSRARGSDNSGLLLPMKNYTTNRVTVQINAADGGKETRPKNVAVNWIIKY